VNDEEMTEPKKNPLEKPKSLSFRTRLRDGRYLLIALYATGHVDVACTEHGSQDRVQPRARDVWNGFDVKPTQPSKDGRSGTTRAYGRAVHVALERVLRSVFREVDEAQTWHRDVEAWVRALVRKEAGSDKRTVEALVKDTRVRNGFHELAWTQEVSFGIPDCVPIREALEEEAQKVVLEREGAHG
jgi:hypothetical protein